MARRFIIILNSDACRYCIIAVSGIILGLVVGFAAGGIFLKGCPGGVDAPFGCAEYFLFRYQTFAAGLLALIGAWLLWVQIQDQRRQAQAKQKQDQVAARIRMPHALSKLSAYWQHCYDAWEANDLDRKTIESPYDAIEVIMAAAPAADPATFETIKKLTVLSQAFEARLRPLRDLGTRERLRQMIVDIARLSYLTDALYGYGRLEEESAPYHTPDRDTLREQLNRYLPYRQNSAVLITLSRIDEAFDRQFGRRPGALAVIEEDEAVDTDD